MKIQTAFLAALFLAGCQSNQPAKLNHDYPAPPSIKRLAEPGACPGGNALAALDLPLPKFPFIAKRQGRQGWVVVSLDVMADGTTDNVFVKRSAPRKMFDKSAIKAVRTWQFQPPENPPLQECLVFIKYKLGSVSLGN